MPGDKSISHRALLLGALCEGETRVRGWGRSGDTESTLAAVRALGVRVDEVDVDTLVVHGVGLRGLRAPDGADRLRQRRHARAARHRASSRSRPGRFELVGDESLSRRPMERVAEPLRRMGAQIETTDGCLPLAIDGRELEAIEYELPVASAQVKSAILLAGLGARGRTTVDEPAPTRDHTELMLRRGRRARHRRTAASVTVEGGPTLRLPEVHVPGDISSAAPFLVAAALLPGLAPDRARRRPQPAPHRAARRARADGRAHRRSTRAIASRAS